jgi:UMF1 family MFS transporter
MRSVVMDIENKNKKEVVSWVLYDWANSAFATTIMAGFFPVFFKQFLSAGADAAESTFRLGAANSLASIIVVALAPILGSIADRGGAKKKFLFFFAAMGIVMTGALYFVQKGQWEFGIVLYIFGTLGFMGGNVFYDSLIVGVVREEKRDVVSATGFAIGYLGGGLLFAINVMMTLWPQTFGLADASVAVRVSFVSVAIWWAVFSIPVFLFVKEPSVYKKETGIKIITGGFVQLSNTFREIQKLRIVLLFLIGYWLYIDGLDTIVRMAVDYGMSLGFDTNDLILALLITQFVGFPATLVFGKLGEKWGAKTAVLIGIGVYITVTVWAYSINQVWEFYLLAIVIGLVQGGVQSLSRSLYSRIIPANKAAEYFGFYNMLGKFAAVLGPILIGWVSVITQNPRLSILSIIVLFLAGGLILYFVDEQQGRKIARELEQM